MRKSGIRVTGMVSIFTYGFKVAAENFRTAKVKFYSLSDYDALIRKALELGYVTEDQIVLLKSWRTDPASWKP